jgi:hypothetical protein
MREDGDLRPDHVVQMEPFPRRRLERRIVVPRRDDQHGVDAQPVRRRALEDASELDDAFDRRVLGGGAVERLPVLLAVEMV